MCVFPLWRYKSVLTNVLGFPFSLCQYLRGSWVELYCILFNSNKSKDELNLNMLILAKALG